MVGGLTALVNHPARVSGQIGLLVPSARFHFAGDAEVFNQFVLNMPRWINNSASLLERGRFVARDDQGFELSIAHEGTQTCASSASSQQRYSVLSDPFRRNFKSLVSVDSNDSREGPTGMATVSKVSSSQNASAPFNL